MSDEHQRPTVPSVVPPSRAQVLFAIFQEATGVPPQLRQQWGDLSDAHRRGWHAVAEDTEGFASAFTMAPELADRVRDLEEALLLVVAAPEGGREAAVRHAKAVLAR